MTTRILIVEDDFDLRQTLVVASHANGYEVTECASLAEARKIIATAIAMKIKDKKNAFDIVLLDLNLPDGSGETLLPQIRNGMTASILIISATHEEEKIIQLLDAGADDYLVKPFSPAELLARLRVAERHRRQLETPNESVYEYDGLLIDSNHRIVSRDGIFLHLTRKEMQLLMLLAKHPGRVYTHRQLLTDVWGAEFVEHTHYLRIYMAQLRAKIERNSADPIILLTETGVGYRLKLVG